MNLQFWCYIAGLPFKIDLRDGAKVHEWLQMLRSRIAQEQAEQELQNSNSNNTEPRQQCHGVRVTEFDKGKCGDETVDGEIGREWIDDERLAVRRVAYECDVVCYEELVALMGPASHGLREPQWSDYANLEISVPGAWRSGEGVAHGRSL